MLPLPLPGWPAVPRLRGGAKLARHAGPAQHALPSPSLAAACVSGSAASEAQRSATVSHVPRQATLGLHLARFPEAVEAALADLKPNHIADYAFNLAGHYNSFYADCQARPCRGGPGPGRGAC
jgi:hypothetical protein